MASHGEDMTRSLTGSSKEGSDELTLFAPFEASRTVSTSLPYRGEASKPPQVEINDASLYGPTKVQFWKLRSTTASPDKKSSRGSPQPLTESEASRGGSSGRRVRVHEQGEGVRARRFTDSGRPPAAGGRVTKSLVLNRIGTLGGDQDTRQDLKRYWMPDSVCKECSECGTKFNIIVRRHHCRICGRIFCNACCSLTIPGMKLRPDLQGNLRVCKECLEIFQEFQTVKRSDWPSLNSEPTEALPASSSTNLQKNIGGEGMGGGVDPVASLLLRAAGSGNYGRSSRPMTVLSPHKSWDDASSGGRSLDDPPSVAARMNVGFDNPVPMRSITGRRRGSLESLQREERLMALNEDEVEYVITEVWFQLISPSSGIGPQNHRYRLRTFPNTFSASEIIVWLIRNGHATTREAAVTMGQALVDTKRLRVVGSLDDQFKDEANLFLEFGQAADMGTEQQVESPTDLDAPKWFQRLPENGDSAAEHGHITTQDTLSVRYSVPGYRGSFMSSTQPTTTISTMSELTGVVDSVTVSEKALKDEYVVVAPDSNTTPAAQQSTSSSSNELKLSLHGEEHSVSPVTSTPPPSLSIPFDPLSPSHNAGYTVVNDRDIIKAIPVAGLSSAADAAQDFESENGKDVKSNEEARALFEKDHTSHFDALMIQLIKSHGMSLSWLKVIKPLIMEASRTVKTNVYSTDIMDIKEYIKVKKIPGGRRSDSTLIHGVVCTKNITHKKMKIDIRKPTILLLKCAFEFQRKENQLSSFDTLQMQEEKYLKNLVARVKTFQPRVILVQKSVARLALEMLYHLDIVVAVNIKPSVMERVARCTQGDLLHSLDQLFFNVQLGSCGEFYLRNFVLPDGVKKTLMYFDFCDPRLGCVITLMGGSRRELKKVKKATLFGVFIAYNSQLESSFLIDEFAWPASDNPHLLPRVEGYSSSPTTPEWPLHPSLSYPVEAIPPSELARKLEALVPEFTVDLDPNDMSSQSTPTMSQSNLANGNSSNSSPLMSHSRPNSVSGTRNELVAQEDGNGTRNMPTTPCLADDVKSQSDPLSLHYRGLISAIDTTTLSRLGEREFEKVLSSQILSITPDVKFPIPYLQSSQGFDADLRKYLPSVIYWSYQFLPVAHSTRKKLTTCMSSTEMDAIKRGSMAGSNNGCDRNRPVRAESESPQRRNQLNKSYCSISEHPFTTSIFLLKANTNEMRAALADYRANSGLVAPAQEFFFPTASRASNYRMHLQNIFNKYQQFGLEQSSPGSAGEGDEREDSGYSELGRARKSGLDGIGGSGGERDETAADKPLRQRMRRHNTLSSSSSSERNEGAVAWVGSGGVRSCEASDGRDHAGGKGTLRTHTERRESTPLVTMGTLDDIDRDYSKLVPLPLEDELLDLHGNKERATPPPTLSDNITLFPPYQQVDCMDPVSHQSISILFSSTCHDGQRHQLPCVPPCIIQMSYYGHNDISLGDFLKRYCFRPDYRCQTCSSEMIKHQRHIIHGPASLHITVQQLDTSMSLSNDGIFAWLACKHCTLCTPYSKMSDNSLLFSFAKFLELKFHCNQYVTRFHSKADTTCQHSLHSDYLHYFSFCNKIACFQPAEISILEVRIPPTVIVINTPHSEYHHNFAKEIKHIEHITEGVSYRIRQRLQTYNMEPVTAQVKDCIASSKGERDAFRRRIKLLKEKVVHGGFLESGGAEMGEEEQEAELAALQDGIAEIKRALTEFVACWNIELESLDNRIKVYQSRRDVSRNSDRDSPFAPMAAEVPVSRGTTPRGMLLPPQPEDNLLFDTPQSTPPDSGSLEDITAAYPSLNREAGSVAVAVEGLIAESQTEVGEEVRGGTRSSRDNSRCVVDDTEKSTEKTASSNSISSSDDVRISSQSLSGEMSGAGREVSRMETVSEHNGTAVAPAKQTVVEPKQTKVEPKQTVVEPKETKVEPKGTTDIPPPNVVSSESCEGEREQVHYRHRTFAFSKASSKRTEHIDDDTSASNVPLKKPVLHPVPPERELAKRPDSNLDRPTPTPDSEPDTQASVLDGNQRSTNATPNTVMSENDLEEEEGEGEGERERWWTDSPMSNLSSGANEGQWREDTPSDSEAKGGYQNVKTLVMGSSGGPRTQNLPGEEVQTDGVGIFAKFRGARDTDVREDPTRFYLVDAAAMSKASPIITSTYMAPESQQNHHHGPRPHRRPGTIPRKNGSGSAPSPTDIHVDGRTSRGVKERDRSALTRPFQKLPPPFELDEHHNMHKSLKIPIAIYEKEPTSLIAYALSSREYAQEYWAMVERRPSSTAAAQPEKLTSRPSSPKAPKKQADPLLFQLPPPTKTSALKQAYQELKKKGPLNAMNVFSGLSATSSDRPDPHDKSGNESRRIEAALSSKSSQTSSSSTPSKSSQTSSSSFPPTDQTAVPEDGEGFRWNTTGDHPSTGSSSKAGHISLEFTAPDRTSSIFCKVYFAEEFHHLREMVFPSGEDKFIRSLSRCVKFDAKGGKSRSTFCKVIDDRFIMKQIKTVEISSFEQIAPLYFDHITTALENKRPLALAKILGVYTIGYHNTRTGNSKRLDVIVMENLLYGRKSSKVFDLKGSMRSRYIDPSKDSSSDVLLDENFLNHICYSPVYVHPHSKAVLMKAIQEDTEFLAQNAIMDYSLLTCIEDQSGELVVGIIDYVRTFTLDKRLEMYIKKTAGRVLPTVVYPELYRKRFCEAMDRYFTVVPDKWTGLGADMKL